MPFKSQKDKTLPELTFLKTHRAFLFETLFLCHIIKTGFVQQTTVFSIFFGRFNSSVHPVIQKGSENRKTGRSGPVRFLRMNFMGFLVLLG